MSHKWVAQQVVAYESLKISDRSVGNSQKWSRLLMRAFIYSVRGTIQTGFHNGGRNVQLVAYESDLKESFDYGWVTYPMITIPHIVTWSLQEVT